MKPASRGVIQNVDLLADSSSTSSPLADCGCTPVVGPQFSTGAGARDADSWCSMCSCGRGCGPVTMRASCPERLIIKPRASMVRCDWMYSTVPPCLPSPPAALPIKTNGDFHVGAYQVRAIAFSESERQPCTPQVRDCTRSPHSGRRGRSWSARYACRPSLVCALPVDWQGRYRRSPGMNQSAIALHIRYA